MDSIHLKPTDISTGAMQLPGDRIGKRGMEATSKAEQKVKVNSVRIALLPPEEGIEEQINPDVERVSESEFGPAFEYFVTNVENLRKYLDVVDELARRTGYVNFVAYSDLIAALAKDAVPDPSRKVLGRVRVEMKLEIDGKEQNTDRILKIYNPDSYKRTMDFLESQNAAHNILFRTSIQFMSNALEQLFADLLRAHYLRNPSALSLDKTISLGELQELGSLDEIKDYFIANEVTRLGMTSSEEQIALFDKKLKGTLRQAFPEVDELIEVLIRRHAITHADGYASREYCQRLRRLKLNQKNVRPGMRLVIDRAYIDRAWELTFSFGCILAEMVWKQEVPDESDSAEHAFNLAGYRALILKRYKAAERIFLFGLQHKRNDESHALMNEINYCIAMKGQDNFANVASRVCKEKWNNRSPLYQMAASVLREDTEEIKLLLKLCAQQKAIALSDFFDWPLFRWVRESSDASTIIKHAFGPNASASQQTLFHLLMLEPETNLTQSRTRKQRPKQATISTEEKAAKLTR